MKKVVLVLSLMFCLSFASSLKDYKTSVKAISTWIVNPGESIQDAINNAADGDTIFVRNGIYYENIFINKSITLIGENKDQTIIDGSEIKSVIFIKEAENVSISQFTLRNSGERFYNSSGVLIEHSSGCLISNNIIISNHYGINLLSSSNTVICANNISENSNGVSLYLSTNNLIEGNAILNNVWGISLYLSTNNMIKDNNVLGSGVGIGLDWSSNNVISANTIVKNSNGIIPAFSSNNMIYNNNFNNTLQVWSYNSTNFWSYDGEGNYWSDYNGSDFYSGFNQDHLGSDGIGDVPYIIDETNVDGCPLMGMFHSFGITYKQEAYHVAIVSNSTISNFQFYIGMETGNKIICFEPVDNENVIGFCRVMIPTKLMSYPYIVLLGSEEISPAFLDVSNETCIYLYFTYLHKNQTVTIISPEWYTELLSLYYDLNMTYYNLLNIYSDLLYNYTILLGNYTQLQKNFELLNASYQSLFDLNVTFHNFLDAYARLQADLDNLSLAYQGLFNAFTLLSGNYTQLQEEYQELYVSYQDHLRSYSENVSNVKNLIYILAAMTAILIIVTTYLSKRAHSSWALKIKRFGEE